jgi:transglutaminase-like putative cysteine protease
MRVLILPLLISVCSLPAFSQDNVNLNFGKISLQDFNIPASPVIDSNSNAVIISDLGSTSFIGNEYHWFSYVYKKHIRIKIINDKAADLFTVKIRLYGLKKNKDKLTDLKATTYNIINGNVEASNLGETDIFEDVLSPYTSVMKFTLPKVRSGSIIEYSYTITSYHSYNIPAWYFQHVRYPCLYSEYKVVFPNALRYFTVRYGLDSFSVNKTSVIKNNRYEMGDIGVISNDIMDTWALKNIPPFAIEKFIGSPKDYLDKIEFFLAQTYNGQEVEDVGSNWQSATDQLLTASYFGGAVDRENATNLFNTAENVTSGDKSLDEFARHIYYYVRDNFNCISDDEIYLENDLYEVNKKKKGNVAEINLLLVALLRQKGLQADPVLLSTTDYGKNPSDYPVLDKMNYVIGMVRLDGDTIYLDASRPYLGFGNLSIDCYNGHARIISKNGSSIYFSPEKITEQRNTSVIIYNNEKEKLTGSCEIAFGNFGSEKVRRKIKEIGPDKYFDNLKSNFTVETDISTIHIDSLSRPEFPVTVKAEFKIPASGDILYLNPFMISEYKENPFKSEERRYPVLLTYPINDLYILNMEIPDGYTVEELPKSAKVSFNGDEGFFEYLIEKDQNRIQFRSHIKLDEVAFSAEDYNSLRSFFSFIIKKYSEQIVFKKK